MSVKKIIVQMLTVVLVLCFQSCDDKDEPIAKVNQIVGKWIISDYTRTTIATGEVTNGFDALSVCEKDDVIEFREDMTYKRSEGEKSCEPPYNEEGPYSVNEDETSLTLLEDEFGLQVDHSTMTISREYGDFIFNTKYTRL